MRKSLSLFISSLLAATTLVAISSPQAFAAATLTTCTNLETGKTLVLRSADAQCRSHLGSALWVQEQSDTASRTGAGYASITVCSSKNPLSTYRLIKDSCPKFLVSTNYWRTVAVPATPIIEAASARGYDSAALFITPATFAPSAPVLYYLVTDMKSGLTSKVMPRNLGHLYLSGLSAESTYTFTIAAVSVDGTSLPSSVTPVITTGAAPVVVVASTAAALAAPAFTLSSASETRTVNTSATGFTISSTGGAIASFAINATPAGMGFETSTGTLTGTPTTVAGATAYTITATNAAGSAAQIFTLTVAIAVPVVISVAAIAGVTAPVTDAAPVATTTAGTGYLGTVSWSDTPITFAGIATYTATITLTTAAGYTLTGVAENFFTVIGATSVTHSANAGVITAVFPRTLGYCDGSAFTCLVGDTGPGGGKIFYVATAAFACGPTGATTCSYLEAAPTTGTGAWANTNYLWSGNTTMAITTTQTAIGTGYQNTLAIIGQASGGNTASRAGTISQAYRGPNNLTDWFLPSKDELNQMCKWASGITGINLTTVTTRCSGGESTLNTGAGAAGFSLNPYWSSSEVNATLAWRQDFKLGSQNNDRPKSQANYVRPVRAF